MTSIGDSMKWLGIGASEQGQGGLNAGATAQDALQWVQRKEGKGEGEDDDKEDSAEPAGSQSHREVGESPSSPASVSNPQGSNTKAAKDRSCPFCGQAFTSSSLGRHLDLYVKPRNPKPPDGVHNVDEIRKMRGGITRRQPRTSMKAATPSAKEKPRTWDAAQRQHQESVERSDYAQSPQNPRERETVQTFINVPNWQATGVINNLPPRSGNATPSTHTTRPSEIRHEDPSRPAQRPNNPPPNGSSGSDTIWKLHEAAEQGRAAELALREVLGSLEAARKRAEPLALFEEFDFFSLSFPGLCLAVLPGPGTLFSPTPFPSPESWSLQPPKRPQRDATSRKLQERVRERSQAARDRGERDNGGATNEVVFKHNAHLDAAWEHWESLPASEQSRLWTLEVLRAFSRERDARHRAVKELERERQHSRHLEAQYDRLARCQLPREWQIRPPTTVSIPPSIVRNLDLSGSKTGVVEAEYDVDTLLDKWKAAAKAVSRAPRTVSKPSTTSTGVADSQYVSNLNLRENNDPGAYSLQSEFIMNGSVWGGVGGPMSRQARAFISPNPANTRDGNIVGYETPPQPGTVVDPEGDDGGPSERDADPEAGPQDRARSSSYVDRSALAKQRHFVDAGAPRNGGNRTTLSDNRDSTANSPSTNGAGNKRPLPYGLPEGGRGKTPKVLKADVYNENARRSNESGKGNRTTRGAPEGGIDSVHTFGLLPFGIISGEAESSDDEDEEEDDDDDRDEEQNVEAVES